MSTKTQRRVIIYSVTWAEVIRKLRAAGYVDFRKGKGSHRHLIQKDTKRLVTVSVHTKKDAGELGNRILREAGVK
jgi:predicted RNA binding protein YcfA (HicA-like mRNA interferase family)